MEFHSNRPRPLCQFLYHQIREADAQQLGGS
jgi:hypothetical protein